MRLLLIRHAQSANNAFPEEQRVEDPSLTPLGHRQAAALAVWLKSAGLNALIASPFRRALETAEHLHQALGIVPRVWIDLHEQGGCYAGHEPQCYRGRPGMNRRQINADFPGYEIESGIGEQGWWASQPYESETAAAERARRLWLRTLSVFGASDCHVGFVMHADFKRLFLAELFAQRALPNANWNGIYNTAVTALNVHVAEPQLGVFNSIVHLPDDLASL